MRYGSKKEMELIPGEFYALSLCSVSKSFDLGVLPNLVTMKMFTLQRRFCNRELKVVNVSWVTAVKICLLYHPEDTNA